MNWENFKRVFKCSHPLTSEHFALRPPMRLPDSCGLCHAIWISLPYAHFDSLEPNRTMIDAVHVGYALFVTRNKTNKIYSSGKRLLFMWLSNKPNDVKLPENWVSSICGRPFYVLTSTFLRAQQGRWTPNRSVSVCILGATRPKGDMGSCKCVFATFCMIGYSRQLNWNTINVGLCIFFSPCVRTRNCSFLTKY